MSDNIERFIFNTLEQFRFLENDNGYKVIVSKVENSSYFPDAEVAVKYISSKLEIKVFWYFASAIIGVAFLEIKESRITNLYSLVNFLFPGENELFLLQDTDIATISKIKKREKIINENMQEVIRNLALATQKFAGNIIQGDTSIFNDIIKYQDELIKKQNL